MHHGIAELRLAHPPVNALGPELVDALRGALADRVAADARAVVLSGSPGLFSAGLDVPALMPLDRSQMSAFWSGFFGLLEDVARCPVPVVAAMTGHSPAGGTVLALFCDYRILARGPFEVGLNEVQVGLVVPGVIRKALARQIGAYPAERHLVAGRLIDPEAALAIGLVDELCEPAATVERAIAWCDRHLELPALALHETRRLARSDLVDLFDDGDNVDIGQFCDHWFRDETRAVLMQLVRRLGKD